MYTVQTTERSKQGVTKRCRLSWLTNSTLVYEPKCGGRVGVARSQPMSTALYFGYLTPYLTYSSEWPCLLCRGGWAGREGSALCGRYRKQRAWGAGSVDAQPAHTRHWDHCLPPHHLLHQPIRHSAHRELLNTHTQNGTVASRRRRSSE